MKKNSFEVVLAVSKNFFFANLTIFYAEFLGNFAYFSPNFFRAGSIKSPGGLEHARPQISRPELFRASSLM